MNRDQNSILTRGKRVIAVLIKFVIIVNGILKLKNLQTSLVDHVAKADGFKDDQTKSLKGYTTKKKNFKKDGTKQAVTIAGLIYELAVELGDTVLQEAMKLVKTSFDGKGENTLSLMKIVLAAATTNKVALADYGMTPAMLTEYSDNVDAVEADLNIPKAAIDQKHFETSSLEAELEASEVVLAKGVEKLMPQFKKSQPEFFSEFNSANQDTILGSHKTRDTKVPMGTFKLVLRDKNTLSLIAEGLVKIELDEEDYIYSSKKQNIFTEPIGDFKGTAMATNHKPTAFTGTVTNATQTIEVLMEPLI